MCGESGDGDPLVACALFFQNRMANQGIEPRDRINAANGLVKLLGLHRQAKSAAGGGDGESLIAEIIARRTAARRGGADLN